MVSGLVGQEPTSESESRTNLRDRLRSAFAKVLRSAQVCESVRVPIADRLFESSSENKAPLLHLVDSLLDEALAADAEHVELDYFPKSDHAREAVRGLKGKQRAQRLTEMLQSDFEKHTEGCSNPPTVEEFMKFLDFESPNAGYGLHLSRDDKPDAANRLPERLALPIVRAMRIRSGLDPADYASAGILIHLSDRRAEGQLLGLYELTTGDHPLHLRLHRIHDPIAEDLFAREPVVWTQDSVTGRHRWQNVPQTNDEPFEAMRSDTEEQEELDLQANDSESPISSNDPPTVTFAKLCVIQVLLEDGVEIHCSLVPTCWRGRIPFLCRDRFQRRELMNASQSSLRFELRFRRDDKWTDLTPAPAYLFRPVANYFCALADVNFWSFTTAKGVVDLRDLENKPNLWIFESQDLDTEFTLRKADRDEIGQHVPRPIELPQPATTTASPAYRSCRRFRHPENHAQFITDAIARATLYAITGIAFHTLAATSLWDHSRMMSPVATAGLFGVIGLVVTVVTLLLPKRSA